MKLFKTLKFEFKWVDTIINSTSIMDSQVKVCPKWIFLRTKQRTEIKLLTFDSFKQYTTPTRQQT